MKKVISSFFILFVINLFSFTFSFALATTTGAGYQVNIGKGVLTFPYKIDFTQSEINFLKTLDDETLQKIVQISVQVYKKNQDAIAAANASSTSATNTNNSAITYSNTYSTQTPYYNSQTRQYQSKPVTNTTQNTAQNSTPYYPPAGQPTVTSNTPSSQTPYYNSQTGQYQNTPPNSSSGNPYLDNPTANPYLQNQQQQNQSQISSLLQGVSQGLTQRSTVPSGGYSQYDKEIDMTGIEEMCKQNYGVDISGSCPDIEHASAQLKNTTMKACSVVKKRLKSSSVYRSPACNSKVGGASGSSHMSGNAIDLSFQNLTSEERVKVFRTFKINGFTNLGCYGPNSAIHLDNRPGAPRRWGSSYTSSSYSSSNCPNEVFMAGY